MGNKPYLNHALSGQVVVDESMWTMDDGEGEIEINLQKMKKGDTWGCVFENHGELNPFAKGEVQKQMMLERFQAEVRLIVFISASIQ